MVLAEVGTHSVVDAATGGPAVDPDQVSYSSGSRREQARSDRLQQRHCAESAVKPH